MTSAVAGRSPSATRPSRRSRWGRSTSGTGGWGPRAPRSSGSRPTGGSTAISSTRRTGEPPADGPASVTVLAPTAAEADALSTAFYLLGPEGSAGFLADRPDVAALFVTRPELRRAESGRDVQPDRRRLLALASPGLIPILEGGVPWPPRDATIPASSAPCSWSSCGSRSAGTSSTKGPRRSSRPPRARRRSWPGSSRSPKARRSRPKATSGTRPGRSPRSSARWCPTWTAARSSTEERLKDDLAGLRAADRQPLRLRRRAAEEGRAKLLRKTEQEANDWFQSTRERGEGQEVSRRAGRDRGGREQPRTPSPTSGPTPGPTARPPRPTARSWSRWSTPGPTRSATT